MANHALPTTLSLYTDVLTNLKDRIDDSLKMLDSVNTSPTNVPTNAVRWNSTTKLWEKYNGSTWNSLAASYAIQVLKSSNLVGGNSTTLLGSIPYQSNTDTTSLLSPNTTTTRKFLRQTGTGTNGSTPVWDTILAADIPTLNQNTTGNAATATKLTTNSSNWVASDVIGNVVGMLAWKNYGNGNVIFDASNGTAPNGVAVNNANAQIEWGATHPNLMGWNGVNTYGVRVDSARVADSATTATTAGSCTGNAATATTATTAGSCTGNAATATTASNALALNGRDASYYQTALGFNPVQQGTGIGQTSSSVKIGWSSANRLKVTVDITDIGNVVMDSDIGGANSSLVKTALNASGGAPIYACRAWVNFNGTGTVAIRASGNVSSITDNGVGDYTVNFTTAMPDVNYSVASMCSIGYPSGAIFSENSVLVTTTTSSQRFYTGVDHAGTNIIRDQAVVQVQIFR